MRLSRGLLSLFLAPLLAGCAGEYPQSSIAPVSDFAEIIQGLYVDVFWWSVLVTAVVWIALAVTVVRFRDRPGAPKPKQTHGHLGLEIGWTIGPALIVVAIAIPTIQAIFATQQGAGEDGYVIDVVGHQFWWEFRYPEGVVTANELHLPVGVPLSLRMHSADVIHSFWVPQIGGKRDVNPLVALPEGRESFYNWLHFTVQEPGTYMGQCAEFCGDSHALMAMRVVAESPASFQAWLRDWQAGADTSAAQAPGGGAPANDSVQAPAGTDAGADPAQASAEGAPAVDAAQAPSGSALASDTAQEQTSPQLQQPGQAVAAEPDLVAQGREIFHSSTCIACHAIQGTNAQGEVAPNLTLLGRRGTIAAGWLENTQENLVRWIAAPTDVKPGALMPGVNEAGGGWPATNLSEDQVEAVAAYLASLR